MKFQTTRTVFHVSAAYPWHSGLFCAMFSQASVLLFASHSMQWDDWIWGFLILDSTGRQTWTNLDNFLTPAAVFAGPKSEHPPPLPGNAAMSAAVDIHAHRCARGVLLHLCLESGRKEAQTQTEDAKSQEKHSLTSTHHDVHEPQLLTKWMRE